MTDLAAWLLDRIADDEAVARAATPGPWYVNSEDYAEAIYAPDGSSPVAGGRWGGEASVFDSDETAAHIARHDPARVLAECAAKRRIVKAYEFETDTPPDGTDQPPAMALRLLALPYSDRDGYDPAWAVE